MVKELKYHKEFCRLFYLVWKCRKIFICTEISPSFSLVYFHSVTTVFCYMKLNRLFSSVIMFSNIWHLQNFLCNIFFTDTNGAGCIENPITSWWYSWKKEMSIFFLFVSFSTPCRGHSGKFSVIQMIHRGFSVSGRISCEIDEERKILFIWLHEDN